MGVLQGIKPKLPFSLQEHLLVPGLVGTMDTVGALTRLPLPGGCAQPSAAMRVSR